MTRDDLYGYYRRYYIPNNATLVIVGDVETDAALRPGGALFRQHPVGSRNRRACERSSREQTGERRLTIRKDGHGGVLESRIPRATGHRPDFFPLLVLDAVLTGAKGLNLWSSFRTPPPQRRARLYRALVERGLASSVNGALLPTEQPFLYTVSATATDGTPLAAVEAVLLEELDRVRREGITDAELTKAKAQLKARLVFDNDSITNIAHQLGYFETIAERRRVSRDAVPDCGGDARRGVARRARDVDPVEPHHRLVRSAGAGRRPDAPARASLPPAVAGRGSGPRADASRSPQRRRRHREGDADLAGGHHQPGDAGRVGVRSGGRARRVSFCCRG